MLGNIGTLVPANSIIILQTKDSWLQNHLRLYSQGFRTLPLDINFAHSLSDFACRGTLENSNNIKCVLLSSYHNEMQFGSNFQQRKAGLTFDFKRNPIDVIRDTNGSISVKRLVTSAMCSSPLRFGVRVHPVLIDGFGLLLGFQDPPSLSNTNNPIGTHQAKSADDNVDYLSSSHRPCCRYALRTWQRNLIADICCNDECIV